MLGSLAAVAASAAVPPGTEDAPRHEQRLRDAVGQQEQPASEGERPTEAAASQTVAHPAGAEDRACALVVA